MSPATMVADSGGGDRRRAMSHSSCGDIRQQKDQALGDGRMRENRVAQHRVGQSAQLDAPILRAGALLCNYQGNCLFLTICSTPAARALSNPLSGPPTRYF